jgi:hypothetical protein
MNFQPACTLPCLTLEVKKNNNKRKRKEEEEKKTKKALYSEDYK